MHVYIQSLFDKPASSEENEKFLMSTFAMVLIGWTVLIVVMEFLMWHIFHKKIIRIYLPSEMDLPLLRFFTITHLGICALMHTILLLGVVYYCFFLLW